jgi:cholesterol transport system auxiliary component
MSQHYRWVSVALAAVLCSACTSGLLDSKQPIQQTFVLSSGSASPAAAPALPVDVTVARPTVRPGLDTERIAVLYPDRRLDYYAASRWGASTDIVVQNLLVESLRNSGQLRTAQSDFSAFSSDYLLQTELQDFQAEYETERSVPIVRVTLVCTLGRVRGRQPLASYSATAAVPAKGTHMRAVIAAFEGAYRDASQTIVENTLATLQTAMQSAPAKTETRTEN